MPRSSPQDRINVAFDVDDKRAPLRAGLFYWTFLCASRLQRIVSDVASAFNPESVFLLMKLCAICKAEDLHLRRSIEIGLASTGGIESQKGGGEHPGRS